MSIAKRCCMLIFIVSTAFLMIALTFVWAGPFIVPARVLLLTNAWYLIAVEISFTITLTGLFVLFINTFTKPPTIESFVVGSVSDDEITVTRSALISQVRHVVEESDKVDLQHVYLLHKKQDKLGLKVQVSLRSLDDVNVLEISKDLHTKLAQSLKLLCIDAIDSIELEFLGTKHKG